MSKIAKRGDVEIVQAVPMRGPLSQRIVTKLYSGDDADPDGRTHLDMIIDVLIAKAKQGSIAATNLLFDRAEGRPGQTLSIEQAFAVVERHGWGEIAKVMGLTQEQLADKMRRQLSARRTNNGEEE